MRSANSLGQRTFSSPGYGRLKPVASYQFQWFTVYGSSASARCSLPLKMSALASDQAFAIGLSSAAVDDTPWFSGTCAATYDHGVRFGVLVNSGNIGEATRSNWFIGGRPRIC